MKKSKNYILMAAGFAALVAVVSGITAAPAIAAAVKAALIKNVDERGRSPYGVHIVCTSAGQYCIANADVVPAGKRLVIENVSASFAVSGTTGQGITLNLSSSGAPNGYNGYLNPLPFTFVSYENFSNMFVSNQLVIAYFDAGETPQVFVSGTNTGIQMDAVLSGYFVDLTI